MNKFKIGDYVIVKNGITLSNCMYGLYKSGYKGEIIEEHEKCMLSIRLDSGRELYMDESEIEIDIAYNSKLFKVLQWVNLKLEIML